MYHLYWDKESAAMAPHLMLEEAGASYELIVVDLDAGEHRKPDYLKLNPAGYVPTLITPEGEALTESAALLITLAERHPQTAMLPPPGDPRRAKVFEWLLFLVGNVQGAYKRFYYSDRYSTDPNAATAIKARAVEDLDRYFAMVERRLADAGPFLTGERPSIADLFLLMMATWYPKKKLFTDCPALASALRRLAARPAVARVLESHEVRLP